MRHVVVTRQDRMTGVMRINTALQRGLEGAHTGVTLGEVASRDFTVARENDLAFDVDRAHVAEEAPPWRWSSARRSAARRET